MTTALPLKPYALPEGYVYAETVQPQEIYELRQESGLEIDDDWSDLLAHTLCLVAIRASTGKLVGMGRITGDTRHAVLCDLVVHPDHRRKYLGRIILLERLRRAWDEIPVKYLVTHLSKENHMIELYQELGLSETRNFFGNRAWGIQLPEK